MCEDIQILNKFNEKVDKVKKSKFLSFVKENGVSIKYDFINNKPIEVSHPDEEDLDSIIPTIRMFIYPKEKISLKNINKIYEKNLKIHHLSDNIKRYRDNLNKLLDNQYFPFGIDNITLRNRELLNGYLYTELVHLDYDKHNKFCSAYNRGGIYNDFIKYLLINHFLKIIMAIIMTVIQIQKLNNEALEQMTS